jgi:hypothetical protein
MGHASGSRDLPVGASYQLGPGEQGEEDLKARGLKGSASLAGRPLQHRALALDEDQEGRPVQEGIAGRIDELDALGSQRIGERRRHVVRHEQGVFQGLQLMDDSPQRRGPQAVPDLGEVAQLTAPEPKAEQRVNALWG